MKLSYRMVVISVLATVAFISVLVATVGYCTPGGGPESRKERQLRKASGFFAIPEMDRAR